MIIEILEDCSNINEKEIEYIKEYKDLGICYNISGGGDGGSNLGKHLSEETKRKIGDKNRINMTGRTASDETKKKMSDSQRKRYDLWNDLDREKWGKMISDVASGYRWSEESKRNFSDKQKINPNGAKYDIDTVHKIRDMHENKGMSFTEISKELNIPRGTVYNIATYRRWASA